MDVTCPAAHCECRGASLEICSLSREKKNHGALVSIHTGNTSHARELGVVPHTCNPRTWKAEAGDSQVTLSYMPVSEPTCDP